MSLINFLDFKEINDDRGSLISLEGQKNIPFDIKRTYFLYNLNDESRGFHAHKELEQVALCIKGNCTVLLDNGKEKQSVRLTGSSKGIRINKMIWHEMHDFSDDCIFVVFASEHYDENDYIRDYEVFLREKSNGS